MVLHKKSIALLHYIIYIELLLATFNENSFKLMQQLFADLSSTNGTVVISSASGDEYALESEEWKNGVFTYSILDGLTSLKADNNFDGVIQISELQQYVGEQVQVLTNGAQKPTFRQQNLEDDFVIWR